MIIGELIWPDEFSHADIAHTRHVIDRLEHRWATRLQQDA
jgi:hypothetical protein